MAVTAVVFDIGNVLIEWQPERFFDAQVGEARRRAMFAAVDLHGLNDAMDRGAPFRDTFYNAAQESPEFRDEIRLWHDKWLQMAGPAIPHSVTLLRRLRARGIPVFALSNFGTDTFAMSEIEYPFLTEFDRRYISGHLKTIKPEARIYELLEADWAGPVSELLFADDRIDNINAAHARGWQTHHFDGPTGFAARLVAEGLLTEKEACDD